jgi:hypothetical protein
LDTPDLLPPDVHIWTSEKQPWIVLSNAIPAFEDAAYDKEKVWSVDSLQRRRRIAEMEST